MRRRDRARPPEPARCQCEPGGNAAAHHGRPGAKAADHGDPFTFTKKKGCIHSELALTTKPTVKRRTSKRLRFS